MKSSTTPSRAKLIVCGLLVLAPFAALASPARSEAAIGDLTYLGCIANRGENRCDQAPHPSLHSSRAVAVSRDGKSVYVTSVDAITWFKRRSNGTLAYRGCIAQNGAHGCAKPPQNSLSGSLGIAVSRDGKSVYVTSLGTNSITRFNRHANGALTYKGCFANRGAHGTGGCKRPPHDSLGEALGVAVSRDGKSVYVASSGHSGFPSRRPKGGNSITRFKRNSKGALTYGGCFANGGRHGCRKPRHDSLYAASGVAVSPDGRSVYVGSRPGVTTFKRASNGALAYRGCIANQGHNGCEDPPEDSLTRSWNLAVSPDGRSLYVASSAGVVDFGRAGNGRLAYEGCIANRGRHGCVAPVHDSLHAPYDLAISRDGASVYVTSIFSGSITAFNRAPDGVLADAGCFANAGARGCEVPGHDSLGDPRGVAVSSDGRSVYVAAWSQSNAITLFSRESSGL